MSTKETETGVRVAVDVGGTFTDVFVLDADGHTPQGCCCRRS